MSGNVTEAEIRAAPWRAYFAAMPKKRHFILISQPKAGKYGGIAYFCTSQFVA